ALEDEQTTATARARRGPGVREGVESGLGDLPREDVGGHPDASRPIGHNDGHEPALAPVDEPAVIARNRDPSSLVQDGDARLVEIAVELSRIANVSERPEEEPCIARREMPLQAEQGAAP